MQPIDHLHANSIHLKAHICYYQFSLSNSARLPQFSVYYGRPTRSAKSFSRTGPIEVSTADVPAPLPNKEHIVLPILNTARADGRTTGPTACVPPQPPPPALPPPASSFLRSARPHHRPHNHRPHTSPFLRTGELRRALKNRLTQF